MIIETQVNCLKCISSIFQDIANTPGRLDKEQILNDNKDNLLFKECLRFLLDTYTVTGISKAKLSKKLNLNLETYECINLYYLMDYIRKNNTGKDSDIIVVQKFMRANKEVEDFIFGLITKSLKIGVSKKTANSVYGDTFVDDFKVMKSTNYEEVANEFNEKAEKEGYAIYIKENGIRGEIIKSDSSIKIRSRQGLYVDGLVDLEEAFINAPNGLYEGEILAIGVFKDSNEQCQKTRSLYSKNGIKHGLKIKLFDYVSLEDMHQCKNKVPTHKRKEFIKKVVNELNSEFVEYIEPIYIGKDISMIDVKLKEIISNKLEGISCNILTSPYEFKRSKWAVKVKEFHTIDLEIVGIYEGDSKYKGKMGGMTIKYKNNTVDVGSGWSDLEREYYWNKKEEFIGRILEVKYKDETVDESTGLPSLQFPIKVCVREIGKEVSYH